MVLRQKGQRGFWQVGKNYKAQSQQSFQVHAFALCKKGKGCFKACSKAADGKAA